MSSIFQINPRVGWRRIDSCVTAFNCENQFMVTWNTTASLLWEKMHQGYDFEGLVRVLIDEFGINRIHAEKDVKNFLDEVVAYGLLSGDNKKHQKNFPLQEGESVLLSLEMSAIEKRVPFAITFETTLACNERCIHCFMDRGGSFLSFETIKRILQEVADEGCLFLSLTGGEFFTRPDALDIVSCASEIHFVVDILSNGTLITEDIASRLAQQPVRRVQISLYGATAKTHDAITQVPGSFKQTLKGIRNLLSVGVKVEVAFSLMSANFHERHLVKALVDSLGCLISPNHMITARNNGLDDTFQLRLSDLQLIEFLEDEELSGLYAGRRPFQDHQFYFGFSDLLSAAPCYSGFNTCAITPFGKVLPCNQLLWEVGDLTKQSFSDIWRNSPELERIRNLTIAQLTDCAGCGLLDWCARCPGLALLEGGDLLGSSPENCRVASINHTLQTRRDA